MAVIGDVFTANKKNGNGFVQNHLFLKESQDLDMEKIHIIKHKTRWNSYKIFKKKKERIQALCLTGLKKNSKLQIVRF